MSAISLGSEKVGGGRLDPECNAMRCNPQESLYHLGRAVPGAEMVPHVEETLSALRDFINKGRMWQSEGRRKREKERAA